MAVIPVPPGPTHQAGAATFTSLATPSRGTTDTSVWMVELAPGAPGTPHSLTREEVFVVLEGTATATIDGVTEVAAKGDAISVPPGVAFELANAGDEPVTLLCALPVGGQAQLGDGTTFVPPWSV